MKLRCFLKAVVLNYRKKYTLIESVHDLSLSHYKMILESKAFYS